MYEYFLYISKWIIKIKIISLACLSLITNLTYTKNKTTYKHLFIKDLKKKFIFLSPACSSSLLYGYSSLSTILLLASISNKLFGFSLSFL